MPQQHLDGAKVNASLIQVGRKAVAKRVRTDVLRNPGEHRRFANDAVAAERANVGLLDHRDRLAGEVLPIDLDDNLFPTVTCCALLCLTHRSDGAGVPTFEWANGKCCYFGSFSELQ